MISAGQHLLFAGFGDVMTYRMMIADSESPDEFKDVQIQKLDRMFSFPRLRPPHQRNPRLFRRAGPNRVDIATAATIRSPFDGTRIAQDRLSAIARVNQTVGLQLLVDILRGAANKEIREGGYDWVKTRCRPVWSRDHWVQYVTQLIDRGLVSIDYCREYGHLKMTPIGEDVPRPSPRIPHRAGRLLRQKKKTETVRKETPLAGVCRELLVQLSSGGKQVADTEGISPDACAQ